MWILPPARFRSSRSCYRGLIGAPKTKGSRRALPRPDSLKGELKRLSEKSVSGGIGFSHPQRHPVQRHEPAAQAPETGRSQAGDALAQLAHATPHSRDAFATRGRHAQRDAGTIGPHEDVNSNPRFATFELREEA